VGGRYGTKDFSSEEAENSFAVTGGFSRVPEAEKSYTVKNRQF